MIVPIYCPEEYHYDNVDYIGAAIKRTGPDTFHIGILIKPNGAAAEICHLAWHCILSFDPPDGSYWWVQSSVDEYTKLAILPAIESLKEDMPNIYYSTVYSGSYFSKGTLTYNRKLPSDGLTCATFVMEVFSSFGVDLYQPS